jgi:hypothetical protein
MERSGQALLPPASYVNFLRVAHAESEFFLAFGQTIQEAPGNAQLVASLVTSPRQAKAMLRALAQAVAAYEQHCGPIPEPAANPAPPVAAPPREVADAARKEPRKRA